MCEGQRERHRAAGLAGRTKGRSRGRPGWGHPQHGRGPYARGPERTGGGPYGFGPWRGEPTADDEQTFLKREVEALKHYLEGIERRVEELEKASA